MSSNYFEITGLRPIDLRSCVSFVFDHAVFHYMHSLSCFVLLVFQPYRIAQYFWILTVKTLKFLGVWRAQPFDCLLPFASAWKEFWSTTLRFSQEPQRTFRLVCEEFQSWRTRDHSKDVSLSNLAVLLVRSFLWRRRIFPNLSILKVKTNRGKVYSHRNLISAYVGWVCCWFSPFLQEVFLRVLRFSPLLKNKHFQIPIRSGTHGHV